MRILLLGLWLFLPACIKDSSKFDSQVVERSKRYVPPWVGLEPNFIHQIENNYSFVSYKSQVLDLPLGVKQTQLGGMNASQVALHDTVRKELQDMAEKKGIKITSRSDFDNNIVKSVKKYHGEFAQVADIYFEKVQAGGHGNSPNAYYRVFVLVEFSGDKMKGLLSSLAHSFKSSKKQDLIALSKIIEARR